MMAPTFLLIFQSQMFGAFNVQFKLKFYHN